MPDDDGPLGGGERGGVGLQQGVGDGRAERAEPVRQGVAGTGVPVELLPQPVGLVVAGVRPG